MDTGMDDGCVGSAFKLCKEPRFSIDILRSLRAEVDALLGFLQSDSETEKNKDEATIPTSPTKSCSKRTSPLLCCRPHRWRSLQPWSKRCCSRSRQRSQTEGSSMTKITAEHRTSVSRLPINLCTITKAGDGNTGWLTAPGSSVGLR